MAQHVGQLEAARVHAPKLIVDRKAQRPYRVVTGHAPRGENVLHVLGREAADMRVLDNLGVHIKVDETHN